MSSKNFNIELLPDKQLNNNIKIREIEIIPKKASKLIQFKDIQMFYNSILKDGKYKSHQICIRGQDILGHTITLKGYLVNNINFDEEYVSDKVDDMEKFEQLGKLIFYIYI
jgi:hypothetical protein